MSTPLTGDRSPWPRLAGQASIRLAAVALFVATCWLLFLDRTLAAELHLAGGPYIHSPLSQALDLFLPYPAASYFLILAILFHASSRNSWEAAHGSVSLLFWVGIPAWIIWAGASDSLAARMAPALTLPGLLVAYGLASRGSIADPPNLGSARTCIVLSALLLTGLAVNEAAFSARHPQSTLGYSRLGASHELLPSARFFPSPATTASQDFVPLSSFLGTADSDRAPNPGEDSVPFGAQDCARCHPDITRQWASSAHRFSSFNNPWYAASVQLLREESGPPSARLAQHLAAVNAPVSTGVAKSRWCAGCHDPVPLLTGNFGEDFDQNSRAAQAGLSCLTCHQVDSVHGSFGNAAFVIREYDDPYIFADATTGWRREWHDNAIRRRPEAHKRSLLKEVHGKPEFCAACHKVALDPPVNDYRWIRGQDEYDAWHHSGVAHNAAATFYLPESPKECRDCHMPMVEASPAEFAATEGKVRSHRFLAANTALPALRGDNEMLRATEKMLQHALRMEIFAAGCVGDSSAANHTPLAPLEGATLQAPAGREVFFHVVVRNARVGHAFPGGTIDSNESWIELAVDDGSGWRILSGGMDRENHVDPDAHFYGGVFVDEKGRRIHRRDAQNIRTPAYTRTIGPGTADVARYAVRIPPEWSGRELRLRARLLWRKFDQRFNAFAFAERPEGFPGLKAPFELPVTELGRSLIEIQIKDSGDAELAAQSEPTGDDWERFNDYGIGLLLQGDTRGAAWAFERVAELAPERRDGVANLARVALEDGDLRKAEVLLSECESLDGHDPRTAYLRGILHERQGSYEDAAAAYRQSLERFPKDRDALRRLGQVLYLAKKYEECIEAMDRVLEIDAEDRAAHYHRFLSLQALERSREAERARHAYERFKLDENARQWALRYLVSHPSDSREAQPIHVHEVTAAFLDDSTANGYAAP